MDAGSVAPAAPLDCPGPAFRGAGAQRRASPSRRSRPWPRTVKGICGWGHGAVWPASTAASSGAFSWRTACTAPASRSCWPPATAPCGWPRWPASRAGGTIAWKCSRTRPSARSAAAPWPRTPASRIWIGTDNGVVVFAEGEFSLLHPGGGKARPRGPGHPGRPRRDSGGGRQRLVALFRRWLRPQAVAAPAGIEPANFRALAVTAEGLWLGTNSDGVWLRDDTGWRKYHQWRRSSPRSIYRLAVEPSGTLYIATNDNGVFLKHPGTRRPGALGNGERPAVQRRQRRPGRPREQCLGGHRYRRPGPLERHGGDQPHGEAGAAQRLRLRHLAGRQRPIRSGWGPCAAPSTTRCGRCPRSSRSSGAGDGLDNEWVWKVLRTADGTLWFMTDTALLFRRQGEKTIRALPADGPFPAHQSLRNGPRQAGESLGLRRMERRRIGASRRPGTLARLEQDPGRGAVDGGHTAWPAPARRRLARRQEHVLLLRR